LTRVYTCILCPNGCEITVRYDDGHLTSCDGNLCKKGREYVQRELQDPRRTITSSVLVHGCELPLVSVRLTEPIPRDRIFDVMEVIRAMKINAPVEPGQVLVRNILGLGSDLIATRRVGKISD